MRKTRITAVVAVVLVLLLLVGDRGGQFALERVVGGRVQDALATPERPEVDLGGFPFLPELVTRTFDEVTIEITDADGGTVEVARIDARLTGVQQEGDGVRVESIEGEGIVGYDALSEAAAPLKVSYDGDGLVAVTAGVSFLGEEISASAAGRPRIEDDRLIVEPERASTSLGGDETSTDAISQVPDIAVRLRDVPPNLDIDLDPTEDGIEFSFSGEDVLLTSADTAAE